MTDRRNLRKLRAVVTAQTLNNLYKLADMHGWGPNDVGRVIDKLVRDRMVYLHKRGGGYDETRKSDLRRHPENEPGTMAAGTAESDWRE